MQMCIEGMDPSGGCQYGYSCAYVDALSWASPNKPLPMVRDPRAIFDALYSVSGVGASSGPGRSGRASERSILDWMRRSALQLQAVARRRRSRATRRLPGPTCVRSSGASRIVEARNVSGDVREFPAAPPGIPDSFSEHVRLMFDLQVLAFRADCHARLHVQAEPRRFEPHLSGERVQRPVPQHVASRQS